MIKHRVFDGIKTVARSNSSDTCLWVGRDGGGNVRVFDENGNSLTFTSGEFSSFLAGAREGVFGNV